MSSEKILAIIAIAAVISPILVSVIDNGFRYKAKALEYRQTVMHDELLYARQIFESFTKYSVDKCARIVGTFEAYETSYFKAVLYFPKKERPLLESIHQSVKQGDLDKLHDEISLLSEHMADYFTLK